MADLVSQYEGGLVEKDLRHLVDRIVRRAFIDFGDLVGEQETQ
jgi:hypothetical protein